MLRNHIINILTEQLGHKPTGSQKKLIDLFPGFITSEKDNEILLVKGYAGTGKTTILGAIVRTMQIMKGRVILMAPTGRAARVISSYCNHNAYTIHKKIYRQRSSRDGTGKFVLDRNLHKNTLFIVDEASMIANQSLDSEIFGSGRLLDDLIGYVNNKLNCKLILAGDAAQLPPVGLEISPALDVKYLEGFGFGVTEVFLEEILRQAEGSGILQNANTVRQSIFHHRGELPHISLEGFTDIQRINGNELIETITESYEKDGIEGTIIVTRSNRKANIYNQGIRNRILFREEELAAGDLVMVVKNNYYWLTGNESADFIANGDIMEIVRLRKYEEMYGFRFADALVRLPDYKDTEMEVKLLIDTIYSETASLNREENKKLFHSVLEDYHDTTSKKKQMEHIKANPWFNALQIKFAYAVTCHKAQGGQWKNVFIDQGYITGEMVNKEYLRWMYTAFTRATGKLYLVDFSDRYFK